MDKELFIIIPYRILQIKQLRHTAKIVYGYLRFKQADRGYWEGWIKQISHETGIPYGTVRKDIRQLCAIGLMSKDQRIGRGIDGVSIRTLTRYFVY